MKNLMFLTFLVAAPAFAKTSEISTKCYLKAEAAIEKFAQPGYYDEDGFQAFNCELASNQKAVICDVGALKGGGEASDTFRVVLSASCDKVYRVELTGEE
jgi:hypothetical protein